MGQALYLCSEYSNRDILLLLCSVVLVLTRHSFTHPRQSVTLNQSKDSLLRYYFFQTRVACVLLEVIRGATIRLPRV